MTERALITRVDLKNYKSIIACQVRLGRLAILVGPNGSGKSNFLDALRFVSDALLDGLEQAIRTRGSVDDMLSRSAAATGDHELGIDLHFTLPSGGRGHYGFTLGIESAGAYKVRREVCRLLGVGNGPANPEYEVLEGGAIGHWDGLSLDAKVAPARVDDRLFLVNVSGLPEFRPAYDLLTGMRFYNLNPVALRAPRNADPGDVLMPDGANIASVFRRMAERDRPTKDRIVEYLGHITPGIRQIETIRSGSLEELRFHQWGGNGHEAWQYQSDQVSDGTLRALGVLVALFQGRMSRKGQLSAIGIEEPENALHPAAAGVLFDALGDAAATTQVIVTTHSADLLDRDEVEQDSLLAVVGDDGETRIGPVDAVGRSVLRDRLFTAGELLRMGQLQPGQLGNGAISDATAAAPMNG